MFKLNQCSRVSGGDQQHEGDLQMPWRQRLLLSGDLLAAVGPLPESW